MGPATQTMSTDLPELFVDRAQRLLEHRPVRGSGRPLEVVERAGTGKFEGMPALEERAFRRGQRRGPLARLAAGVLLLRLDRLALPAPSHIRQDIRQEPTNVA